MEDIAGKISLYHNLYLGCLALSLLCLVLAVVLFFVLDIKSVLGYLTGRQAKKKIRELEEANASSGRLNARERSSMQYVAQDMKTDMGIRQQVVPGARKVEHAVEEASHTELTEEAQTTALKDFQGMQETSLLKEDESVPVEDGATAVLGDVPVLRGKFSVERELMLIHTEEVI